MTDNTNSPSGTVDDSAEFEAAVRGYVDELYMPPSIISLSHIRLSRLIAKYGEERVMPRVIELCREIDNMIRGEVYRGWAITFSVSSPVTGRYRALRHGVSMNAATREALKAMIDTRVPR